eukprot:scaffold101757_cov53-Attheya_sp.AAC.1
MAEPTALRLHDNQSFPDQLGYAVHQTALQTMAHLKPKCVFLERYGVKEAHGCFARFLASATGLSITPRDSGF